MTTMMNGVCQIWQTPLFF